MKTIYPSIFREPLPLGPLASMRAETLLEHMSMRPGMCTVFSPKWPTRSHRTATVAEYTAGVKEDNISPWSQSAPYWEKHRENIRKMFSPITTALTSDARIKPSHAVLDVATGPGEPALSIAELVGPNGEVWGIDPASEMVAAALRAAANREF